MLELSAILSRNFRDKYLMKKIMFLTLATASLALTACGENRASSDWVDQQIKFEKPGDKKGGDAETAVKSDPTTDASMIAEFLVSVKDVDTAVYTPAAAYSIAGDLVEAGVTAESFQYAWINLKQLTIADGKPAYDNAGLLAAVKDLSVALKNRVPRGEIRDTANALKEIPADAGDPANKALTAEKANALAIALVKLENYDSETFAAMIDRASGRGLKGMAAIKFAAQSMGLKSAEFAAIVG